MKFKWIFKDGVTETQWDSFPFAYRAMFNAIKNGVEKGRKYSDMIKCMSVTGPLGPGIKSHTYSYATATQKAKDAGIMSAEGQLESREFKRRY